jgi:hypothetical protein
VFEFTGGESRIEVDADGVRKALLRVAPELEKELRDELKRLARQARDEVKLRAPVRTGQLKRNVTTRFQFTKSRTQAFVTVKRPGGSYAWIVEHGRKNYRPFPGQGYIADARAVSIPRFEAGAQKAMSKALQSSGLE